MNLEHSFTVPVGVDEAWRILLDIERIGPCMPGAAIDSVDGDDFTGTVKVKLGPIGLTYKGKASFVEKDEAAHRAVIDARGRDARGNGTASAKVTATLAADGSQTKVLVHTDLDITGKPAQFGRGVMVDVGNKLIGQFADNLAGTISTGDGAGTAAAPTPDAGATQPGKHAKPAKQAAAPKAPAKKAAARATSAQASAKGSDAASRTAAAPTPPPPADPVVDDAALKAVADAPAAYSAPGRPTAAANGSTAGRPPQRDVEPINLIESAGPAVAKRLAPVIIGGLIIAAALRRRRLRRRA